MLLHEKSKPRLGFTVSLEDAFRIETALTRTAEYWRKDNVNPVNEEYDENAVQCDVLAARFNRAIKRLYKKRAAWFAVRSEERLPIIAAITEKIKSK